MNKNSKFIVLIAALAIGAIVLVVSMLGGKDTSTTTQPGTTPSTTPPAQQSSADKYKDELASLEAKVKNTPDYDAYMRISQIYFDIGVENRFTGNLKDCQEPLDKAITNYQAAIKVKDSADAHAGIGASIYNIQAVASYYQPIDNKQIEVADKEFQSALKLDAKNQQALFWYTKFALKFKKDTKLASKYLKELQALKINDPGIQKEVEGLATAIQNGNTTSHSSTSGGTSGAATGGSVQGGTSGGELPSGHPSIGK